ncbi:TonB-dependent receptor [Croceicoccus sp. Ery5]|uniref:TonB-dependent receptor n=1 Tax=Croceicoccus sp. Ery5 TaxID=1703340 RepID=UPI001E3BD717|nr:TonB-dependent receptor [Croceicoccus sp. Ery5]
MGRGGYQLVQMGVSAVALCMAMPACAQSSEQQHYNLPPQDLARSVRAVVDQSGATIVAPADLLAGLRAPALRGEFTPEQALVRLISGTSLRIARVGNALVLQRVPADLGQDAAASDAADNEILVTGTRIRGRAPAGAAVTTIDRSDIEQSGYATTQEILQALPQNFGGGPNETTIETNRGNASLNQNYGSGVNLRGLGTGSTLVLLNGERPPMAGFAGVFTDLSMIPTIAIQRIEVLPDGASALYGSDAVAGVVNIIPRSQFEGFETTARYGLADGFDEIQAGAIGGKRWATGNIVLAHDYYRRSRLAVADRPYISEDLRRFGGGDYRANYANPGTIVADGQTFAIPAGQDGSNLSASDLVAGTQNAQDQWLGADALPFQERHALFAAARQEVMPGLEFYAQALFGSRRFDRHLRASSNNALRSVPITNPSYVDPIGTNQPIQVRYSFVEDLGPESLRGRSEALGASSGLRFDVGQWLFDAHATYGTQRENSVFYNRVNTARLAAALADTDPATAYNLLGDGANTNPATIKLVRGSTTDSGRYTMLSGLARADGPLFQLPGGDARIALGGEYRYERFRDKPAISDTTTLTPVELAPTPMPDPRRVTAGYAELLLPLASPELGLAGLHRLDLSAAVRYEHYSDFGDTTNPKLGLSWQPFESLTLRGTWGTSFRAPTFNDLRPDLATPLQFAIGLTDPASDTGLTYALILRGTVPDLGPERATSWTAGFDLEPDFMPGLTARLTYFDIDYRDRIASPASETLNFLINRATYASIIDAPADPAIVAAYFSGPGYVALYPITASQVTTIIDSRTQNLASQHLNGFDFDLAYQGKFYDGAFEVGVGGSWLIGFRQALTDDAPEVDILDTLGNPVDLRLRGRASYSGPQFGASLFVNYVDGYENRTGAVPQQVDAWVTVDARISYRLAAEKGPLAGTAIALSASNLFDNDPPFTVNNLGLTTIGYDPENASPQGRVVALQVTKSW